MPYTSGLLHPPIFNVTGESICFESQSYYRINYYIIQIIDFVGDELIFKEKQYSAFQFQELYFQLNVHHMTLSSQQSMKSEIKMLTVLSHIHGKPHDCYCI